MNKLIVIVGPTASGKTKLAVDLARKFGGEIVSADSRQVYRGMDIGTGKDLNEYHRLNPSPPPQSSPIKGEEEKGGTLKSKGEEEKEDSPPLVGGVRGGGRDKGIPYHLIDIVSPHTNFTLAQYQKRAYKAIEDILRRGKVPILVGGTGLYVQAVVDGYVLPEAPPDPKLRARLAKLSFPQLRAKLKKFDPATYRAIDKNNRRRLERAIEICVTTGVPLSKQRAKRAPPYDVFMLGLAVPKAELHRRIDRRLKERLKQGMVEEVRRLHEQGISWKRLESFGLEYRHVSQYLRSSLRDGLPSLRDDGYRAMGREMQRAIRDFARRQMTWFKRDKKIVWVRTRPNFRSAKTSVGQIKKEAERLVAEFLM